MHFSSPYDVGNGPMKLVSVKQSVLGMVGAVGFFNDRLSSRCLLVSEIGTLSRVAHGCRHEKKGREPKI